MRWRRAGATLEVRDHQGFTPIMTASEYGMVGLVRLLIEKKADINKDADGHGYTALTGAVTGACPGLREGRIQHAPVDLHHALRRRKIHDLHAVRVRQRRRRLRDVRHLVEPR